jgi:hypothetical protein
MSAKSKAGQVRWQGRQGTYRQDLTDDITNQIDKSASARMNAWTARGRIPLWIRAKAAVRGQRIAQPPRAGQSI